MNQEVDTLVWTTSRKLAGLVILVIWFAAAYVIGTEQLLVNVSASPLAPIALTAVIPVALFIGLYAAIPQFRQFVLAQDIETLTLLQTWRVVGLGFLMLYAHGVLPGVFAFPAGFGDVAVGLMATAVVIRLRRDPEFLKSSRFLWFNFAGLLDFAVAVGTAGLTAGAFPMFAGNGLTSAPMDVWPLNIFPSFIVPLFIIAHLTVLLKVRHIKAADQSKTVLQPVH